MFCIYRGMGDEWRWKGIDFHPFILGQVNPHADELMKIATNPNSSNFNLYEIYFTLITQGMFH